MHGASEHPRGRPRAADDRRRGARPRRGRPLLQPRLRRPARFTRRLERVGRGDPRPVLREPPPISAVASTRSCRMLPPRWRPAPTVAGGSAFPHPDVHLERERPDASAGSRARRSGNITPCIASPATSRAWTRRARRSRTSITCSASSRASGAPGAMPAAAWARSPRRWRPPGARTASSIRTGAAVERIILRGRPRRRRAPGGRRGIPRPRRARQHRSEAHLPEIRRPRESAGPTSPTASSGCAWATRRCA